MFCVLKLLKRKMSILEKLFKFLSYDDYSLVSVPVFKGAPFYLLTVTLTQDVDWNKIIECAGKCSQRLLISQEIQLPQNNQIGTFESQLLYNKLFQNTILEIIKNNLSEGKGEHIAIIDANGSSKEFIKRLSPYASRLTVVTNRKDAYIDLCDEILEKTGLCISILSAFTDAEIKIDINKNIASIYTGKEIFNISTGEGINADKLYEDLLPEGINEYEFYSALYELCGVFSLGECIFETVTVNNEKKLVKHIEFT